MTMMLDTSLIGEMILIRLLLILHGMDMIVPHTWPDEGTYTIRASAEDTNGIVGPETTLEVSMPKNKAINRPFLNLLQNFLENHPLIYQLLQRLLKL